LDYHTKTEWLVMTRYRLIFLFEPFWFPIPVPVVGPDTALAGGAGFNALPIFHRLGACAPIAPNRRSAKPRDSP
jgi:hypothetical protein